MLSVQPELVWEGRIHLGDEPGGDCRGARRPRRHCLPSIRQRPGPRGHRRAAGFIRRFRGHRAAEQVSRFRLRSVVRLQCLTRPTGRVILASSRATCFRCSTHSRTSSNLASRPTLPNNCHHTTSRSCPTARSTLRNTAHRGRWHQNCHLHVDEPQHLHRRRWFTPCCRSNMTAIAKSRTASSSTTSGSTGFSPLSFATHRSSCSKSNRCRISCTPLTISSQTPRYAEAEQLICQRQPPRQ